jgi:hypothetical protein
VEIPLSTAMTVLLANNLGHLPDAVFTYVARTTREHRGGERIVRAQRHPITYGAFYAAFKAAAKAIGRPELRVHDLRHTAGTNTLRATGNLVMAQQLLAHQSINTTRRYAHVLKEDLREALERVHDTGGSTASQTAETPRARARPEQGRPDSPPVTARHAAPFCSANVARLDAEPIGHCGDPEHETSNASLPSGIGVRSCSAASFASASGLSARRAFNRSRWPHS